MHHLYGWVTKTYFFTNTMEELINTELIYLDFLLMSKFTSFSKVVSCINVYIQVYMSRLVL